MSKALAISMAPKTSRGYTERCPAGADDPGQAIGEAQQSPSVSRPWRKFRPGEAADCAEAGGGVAVRCCNLDLPAVARVQLWAAAPAAKRLNARPLRLFPGYTN